MGTATASPAVLDTWQTGDRIDSPHAYGHAYGVVRLAGGFDSIGLPAGDPRICAQVRICEFGWLVMVTNDARMGRVFYGVIDPTDAGGELLRPAVYESRMDAESVAAVFNRRQTNGGRR